MKLSPRRGCLGSVGMVVAVVGLAVLLPAGSTHISLPPLARGAAEAGLDWLSTSAGAVTDQAGRKVLLRGFNDEALIGTPGHPTLPLDDQDAADMAAMGADVVRLPLAWSLLEPTRGHFDQAYLDEIATAVQLLNRHHLYVIPDMHIQLNWSGRYGAVGAPSWAEFDWVPGTPSWIHQDVLRKVLSPGADAATTYFWLSPDWQGDYFEAWEKVAARLRDLSGVAGYDLYNEPHPLLPPSPLFERYWLWPTMTRAIEAIGLVDPNHLFIVESTLFLDLPTWVEPIEVRNLVYSPHFYTGSLIPPSFRGDPAQMQSILRQRQREASQMGAALWIGETGIDERDPQASAWTGALLDSADDLDIGWAWWQWRQLGAGWRIRRPDGSLDEKAVASLAQPYLQAAPPGVSAGRPGADGSLRIAVRAGYAGLPVEVAWPTLRLGPAAASGTCLDSMSPSSTAGRLELLMKTGLVCTVTVTPTA